VFFFCPSFGSPFIIGTYSRGSTKHSIDVTCPFTLAPHPFSCLRSVSFVARPFSWTCTRDWPPRTWPISPATFVYFTAPLCPSLSYFRQAVSFSSAAQTSWIFATFLEGISRIAQRNRSSHVPSAFSRLKRLGSLPLFPSSAYTSLCSIASFEALSRSFFGSPLPCGFASLELRLEGLISHLHTAYFSRSFLESLSKRPWRKVLLEIARYVSFRLVNIMHL